MTCVTGAARGYEPADNYHLTTQFSAHCFGFTLNNSTAFGHFHRSHQRESCKSPLATETKHRVTFSELSQE